MKPDKLPILVIEGGPDLHQSPTEISEGEGYRGSAAAGAPGWRLTS
jgi:hypothetical protein